MPGGTYKNVQLKQPAREKRSKSRGTKLLSASLLDAQKVYGGNVCGRNVGTSVPSASRITTETPRSSEQRHKPASVYAPVSVASGGYQYIYTGSVQTTKKEQNRSVSRLSAYNPDRVPDSKRIMSPEHKEKGGNALSYQWTAGGLPCHGFMW